ncbi:MAG: type IV toxin-antitoxin system AbiEi family antitoxin domain-containing protein [Deltaproteobacteria bacterium]|nr:type IV toxin-antitoxin system AbiEi family antitoxin domain-containing protein [Deltaproteobacteria bacterium]
MSIGRICITLTIPLLALLARFPSCARDFRTGDAIAAGVSQPTLSRLAAVGTITRLEYGLYSHPAVDLDLSELDFAIACT